jgi:hypothetical protein
MFKQIKGNDGIYLYLHIFKDLAQRKYLKVFQRTFLCTFLITLWMYCGWTNSYMNFVHSDDGNIIMKHVSYVVILLNLNQIKHLNKMTIY